MNPRERMDQSRHPTIVVGGYSVIVPTIPARQNSKALILKECSQFQLVTVLGDVDQSDPKPLIWRLSLWLGAKSNLEYIARFESLIRIRLR